MTIMSQQLKLWFTKLLPMSNLARAMVSVSAHRVCVIAKTVIWYLYKVIPRYYNIDTFTELVLLK